MKIERKYLLDLACEGGDLQPAYAHIAFYKTKKLAIATQGNIMALAPYTPDDNEPEEMYLHLKALKSIRKANGTKVLNDIITYDPQTKCVFSPNDPATQYTVEKEGWNYPNWESVFPPLPSRRSFSCNPGLLANLASAIGVKKEHGITLHLSKKKRAAYITGETMKSQREGLINPLAKAQSSGLGIIALMENDAYDLDDLIEDQLKEVLMLLAERNIMVEFQMSEGKIVKGELKKIPASVVPPKQEVAQ